MVVWFYFFLLIPTTWCFFFPLGGGGGCQCAVCPQQVTCPPPPSCAIPLPCPSDNTYFAPPPSPTYQSSYQGSWQPAIPAVPAVSVITPHYEQVSVPPPQTYPVPYQPTYQPLRTAYETAEPVYRTVIPSPTTIYTAPAEPPSYANPVQPIRPVQTVGSSNQKQESEKEQLGEQYGELVPSDSHTTEEWYTSEAHLKQNSGSSYDDTSPALAPPAPNRPTASQTSSYDFGTYPGSTEITTDEPKALLVPASSMYTAQLYGETDADATDTTQSLHSGSTIDRLWVEIPTVRGRITTEGSRPYDKKFSRRHWILKRLRNARQMSASVPRTSSTCNSSKLAQVMKRVIVDDVAISKRTVLVATEQAFDGDKFDVFCATGEFSYSIHSRKYCEVTKNDITCFAFR